MCPGKWETQSRLLERLFSFIGMSLNFAENQKGNQT
tara:strand:- start:150 stop:257 length:108 start_codon:yes stop_codon:yes gene_type:complete